MCDFSQLPANMASEILKNGKPTGQLVMPIEMLRDLTEDFYREGYHAAERMGRLNFWLGFGLGIGTTIGSCVYIYRKAKSDYHDFNPDFDMDDVE